MRLVLGFGHLVFRIGLLAIASGSGWAQISLVHLTACGSQSFPGSPCTIPATAAGNLIVVGFQIGGGANTATTISSITDNVGNVYKEAGPARSIDSGAATVVDIWYAKNSVAGATALTITPSASITNAGSVIWEIHGADPASPLDQTAVRNSQTASSTPSGAPVSITSPAELIISLTEVATNVTGIVAGIAFTNDSTLMANGWAHLITSAAGTYTAQWNQSSAGTYASSTASFRAAAGGSSSACDLAPPVGTIDAADVQAAINMTLGITPCTANIGGAVVCNAAVVQRVINAALGGACVTGFGTVAHYATLSWTASTSPNLVGYNVYRANTSGGPYTKINSSLVTITSYTDSTVVAGQTYYYVATAVDNTGAESANSGQTSGMLVPIP